MDNKEWNFASYWSQLVNVNKEDQDSDREFRYFSIQDLNFYNGEAGRPLYVAFDGMVYDFSRKSQVMSYFESKRIFDLRNNSFLKQFPIVGMLII
jgi:predicted heme/steroid binding protein